MSLRDIARWDYRLSGGQRFLPDASGRHQKTATTACSLITATRSQCAKSCSPIAVRLSQCASRSAPASRSQLVHRWRVRHETVHHAHFPASRGVLQADIGEQTFFSRARYIGTNDVDAARQIALSTHPIGRLGEPADIAKGIVFLVSDDAGFMTGAGLVVDGGLTAQ